LRLILFRIIRLTSPKLNYVICIGAILSYWNNIITFFQSTGDYSSTKALCAVGSLHFLTVKIFYTVFISLHKSCCW